MSPLTLQELKDEVARIMATNQKRPTISMETPLKDMDSLGVTEVCVFVEEKAGVTMTFDEARAIKSFAGLVDSLKQKGVSL